VAVERLAGREGAAAHRGLPVDLERGRLDLTEDDVDHPVDQLDLVGHVVVERHRRDAQLVGELAHRQRLEPVAVGEGHGGLEDALSAEWGSGLGAHSRRVVRFTPLAASYTVRLLCLTA
jgi:hypothetical protein